MSRLASNSFVAAGPEAPCFGLDATPATGADEVKTGTTIMAVEFDGGVVVGADSRTSTGGYVANRVSNKITPVTEHIYCCRSGSAADTQAISDYVRYYMDMYENTSGEEPEVKVAAHLFRSLCYNNKDNLMAGIICAGWDKRNGGSVYSIPIGGAVVKQPFTIGGSGSGFIYGYCDANYRANMTRDECAQFVKNAISLAMSRDGSSGGVIRIAVIDKDGVHREVVYGNQLPQFHDSY